MQPDLSSDESEIDIFSVSSPVRNNSNTIPVRLHILTLLSAIGGFLFGYDTGVISGAMLLLRQEFSLSHLWQEMIVSATVMTACLAALAAGTLADSWGRRPAVIVASVMFTAGSVVIAAAGGPVSLLVGRMIVGVGVGLASHTVPLYIGECSPADKRGKLITMNNIAITGGQLVAAVTCGVFSQVTQGWRWMLGLAAGPAILQLLGFIIMPESPRYLVSKNKIQEAERELSTLRGIHYQIGDEIEDMVVSSRAVATDSSLRSMLSSPVSRMSVMLGCLLQTTQQVAGINTVMYYSASILVMAGMSANTSIWLASLTAAINFISSIIGMFLISKLTRRRLLLSSITIVVVSLISISISFQLVSMYPDSNAGSILSLVSMCVYLSGFAPGLGTLAWVINSELHPGWCRAGAISMATATNWAVNLLVSSTFLSLVDAVGKPVSFLVYAILTTAGGAVLAVYLPETKGISLEDTESLFNNRSIHRIRGSSERSRYSLLSNDR